MADGGVDDGEEQSVVVGFGLHLDVVAYALAGCGVIGEGDVAVLRGDGGELLDDVEEGILVLVGELPALGDGAGEDLLAGPVVSGIRAGVAVDGGGRLLGSGGEGRGGEGEAEGYFRDFAVDRACWTHRAILFRNFSLRSLKKSRGWRGLVATPVAVAAVVLIGLAYDCSDAGTGCSADDGSLEAAAEDCAEEGSAAGTDDGALAGSDTALIAAVAVVAPVVMAVVVVASAAPVAYAVIEVVVVVLRAHRQKAGDKEEWGDEDRFSYLGHSR